MTKLNDLFKPKATPAAQVQNGPVSPAPQAGGKINKTKQSGEKNNEPKQSNAD